MPVDGVNPNMNANAIDSGINNNAIVNPDKNSFISCVGVFGIIFTRIIIIII
jgi:hypothetical protein